MVYKPDRRREESRVLIAGEQRAAIACCVQESQREGEAARAGERN
jgi:hypothetical protein